MNIQRQKSRRQFLQATATFAAPMIVPSTVLGRDGATAANSRIEIGVIGLGARGFNLLEEFLKHKDVKVVSLCDVDDYHHRDREWGKGPAYGLKPGLARVERAYAKQRSNVPADDIHATKDFRKVCAIDGLNAVVVATPDHWHALCTLTALRAGLDVYCEKPVTHLFREGQLVTQEVAKRKAIFQTGSQQRSDPLFRQAVEIVRNGLLGKVSKVEVGLPLGYEKAMDNTAATDPPKHIDYDLWCGPSPVLPYMRARHHRWWRGHRAYGGGVLMDWIGHHNDIAHWALDFDKSGPLQVEAVDWTAAKTDVYDTPHQYEILSKYPNDVTISIASRHKLGTKFIGDAGWLHVTRGRITASNESWQQPNFQAGSKKVYRSTNHIRNFIDGIRSRNDCICPAETAHRSITPGHLGYVSTALKRPLKWNADTETIINDTEANRLLLEMNYREAWDS